MLTLTLGPFTLALSHLLILASLLLATVVGGWLGRRSGHNPEAVLFNLLLVALVGARLAFVVAYAEHFREAPWQVLDIRDGGFIAWPGVLAALALAGWLLWRRPPLRRPLGVALLSGLLLWGMGQALMQALERGTRLPPVALQDRDGRPVRLEDYQGQPLVVNLWATWCPPCRREMPVLASAAQRHADVLFLFVNQGEDAETVRHYLAKEGLSLGHVLLDGGTRLGQRVGSRALPTTLFFDAEGRQVGSHLGELSQASLVQALGVLKRDARPADAAP